jgi:hypothetical protein
MRSSEQRTFKDGLFHPGIGNYQGKNPLPWNIPLRGEGSGFYEPLKGATIKDNLLNAK